MMWNKIILFSLLLVGFNANAQETLSIDKAINITLSNNYGIHIAEYTIEKAENNNHLLNKNLLPTLSSTASASRSSSSLKGTYGTGDEFELDDIETKNYSVGLKVSYTLFDGFQRWYTNKNLSVSLSLTKLDARKLIENTLLQVYAGYYATSLLTDNVENQSQILAISKQRLERIKIRSEYGQVTELDILNAEVDVNNDSIQLLNLENQLANSKRDLNVRMGRSVDHKFNTTRDVKFSESLNKDELLASALDANVEVLRSRKQLLIGQNTIQINKGSWLPKLSLNSNYNWSLQDNGQNLNPGNQNQLQEQQNLGFSTALSLSWNIFDSGSSLIRKQNSEIDVLISENNLELLQQELKRDIYNAWSSYQNALFLLKVQSKNVDTNKNNFNRTEQKFKLGQLNSINFRQAQVNLINAQTAFNKAKFDAKISELQLITLSGRLEYVSPLN